jgi:hypothetical protein
MRVAMICFSVFDVVVHTSASTHPPIRPPLFFRVESDLDCMLMQMRLWEKMNLGA